jgi:Resolvase, N terminal domain
MTNENELLQLPGALNPMRAGAGFKSLGDAWADTTTPHGRLMLTVLGRLAEFEREPILARTSDGSPVRRPRACVSAVRPP